MKVNKVTFYSPGTFVAEHDTRDIDSWDVSRAAEMAVEIVQRHGARPYGFEFSEYVTAPPVDDGMGGKLEVTPRKLRTSGMHYLGGQVTRFEEMPADQDTRILRDNMAMNRWPIVITNANSYRWTQPFNEGDCVVENGAVTVRGDSPELLAYRQWQNEQFKRRHA